MLKDSVTDESEPLEMITHLGGPDGKLISVTQLSSFCYAGRYASNPKLRKTYRRNQLDSRRYALYLLCASSKNRFLGVAQLGERYLGVVETPRSKVDQLRHSYLLFVPFLNYYLRLTRKNTY